MWASGSENVKNFAAVIPGVVHHYKKRKEKNPNLLILLFNLQQLALSIYNMCLCLLVVSKLGCFLITGWLIRLLSLVAGVCWLHQSLGWHWCMVSVWLNASRLRLKNFSNNKGCPIMTVNPCVYVSLHMFQICNLATSM